ncbi:MAG: hypothetical protein MAG431_02013 [Chloroflexi bacterium]|nr:hypothetical protein [Chloroflexota bacterium]
MHEVYEGYEGCEGRVRIADCGLRVADCELGAGMRGSSGAGEQRSREAGGQGAGMGICLISESSIINDKKNSMPGIFYIPRESGESNYGYKSKRIDCEQVHRNY